MQTRLFHLKYSTQHMRRIAYEEHECEGVQFATGIVALDTGVMFSSRFEMEEHFKWIGPFQLTYQDEVKA